MGNIANIVCPKEEGIILTKLQQRANQEARFVIFIPGVFEAEGTRARLGLASGLCPGRLRGAAGIYKKPLSSKKLTRLVAWSLDYMYIHVVLQQKQNTRTL